jgi:hypothetical protein
VEILRKRVDTASQMVKASEPKKVEGEPVVKPQSEEMIKKEILSYEAISKYGWENEGNLVK